jgi:hypothetical protein
MIKIKKYFKARDAMKAKIKSRIDLEKRTKLENGIRVKIHDSRPDPV